MIAKSLAQFLVAKDGKQASAVMAYNSSKNPGMMRSTKKGAKAVGKACGVHLLQARQANLRKQ